MTAHRAKAAALRMGAPGEADASAGSYVELQVAEVPQSEGQSIVDRVTAAIEVQDLTKPNTWLSKYRIWLEFFNFSVHRPQAGSCEYPCCACRYL